MTVDLEFFNLMSVKAYNSFWMQYFQNIYHMIDAEI